MRTPSTPSEYLLLFRNTGWHKDLSPEEIQQGMARFTAWFERLNKERQFKGGGPLSHDGKIVVRSNAVTDGPFAESKEAIAGFFVIQADSLEQAVEIAKGCPGLEVGQTVEVRAIVSEPCELQFAREKMAAIPAKKEPSSLGRPDCSESGALFG
jgi:hypothetical protein